MNDPRLIYKYTHAEAIANGDLRLIDWAMADRVPLYISPAADAKFQPEIVDGVDVKDNVISGAVALALLMTDENLGSGKRLSCSHAGIEYEVELGWEIRNDGKRVPIATVIMPGEW